MNFSLYRRFFLILFICAGSISAFSQSVKSNREIVNELLSTSFAPIEKLSFNESSSIGIQVERNIYSNILESKLIQICSHKKLQTMLSKESVNYILSAKVSSIEISYPKIIASPLFGDKMFERHVHMNGNYILIKDSGVILEKEFNEVKIDSVYSSQFHLIEDSDYSFLKAELPKENLFRTLIEPASIASVSVLIIFLFFSLRSN